ncbi:MAG TPA: DHH family phosphoesterase, partial [Thermoflexales bacterium]|nr:DHH family phosphoesterase [Thermoflexales bacterium]
MSNQAWQQAEGYLRRADRILAITHLAPDGDAIGSTLAFAHALRGMGKVVTIASQDRPHSRFDYLAGVKDFKQSPTGNFDLIVSIDSSDLQRLGTAFMPAQHGNLNMVVFDHHITNTQFGTVNVVDPQAASSAEIILKLIHRLNAPITPDIAVALLTGIITDTLAFRTSNTTPSTLAAAMELMNAGASLTDITRNALVLRPLDQIKFLGAGIAAAEATPEGIVYTRLTRKLRAAAGNTDDRGDAGLVGTLITANEAKIAAAFVELADGSVEVGFRAAPGYDVSQVALEFGGGGHPAAAGCTLPGPMRDVVNRVLTRLKQEIR